MLAYSLKKTLLQLATIFFVTAIASSSFAGKGDKKAAGYNGKITAVADGTITVSNKKLGDKTYKTDASTKIVKLDGTSGTIDDLKTGMPVRVATGSDTSVATEIKAVERKKKTDAKATPSATPVPTATPAAAAS